MIRCSWSGRSRKASTLRYCSAGKCQVRAQPIRGHREPVRQAFTREIFPARCVVSDAAWPVCQKRKVLHDRQWLPGQETMTPRLLAVAGNPETPSPARSMVAPRPVDHSSVAAEYLNPAKMARANGAIDVAAARGPVPPQPLQSAGLHGLQAERGHLLPAQPVLAPYVTAPAPVQHQQQYEPPTWANGAAATVGSQQYPAVAPGVAISAEPLQHSQPPLQTTGSVDAEPAFQHEAGSARAQYWSMHRTPEA